MRKLLIGLMMALFASTAYADFTGKDASGATITFKNSGACTSVVCVAQFQPVDSTGAAFAVTGNPFFISFGTGVTLPAYAATPTFNLGTLNGAALDTSVQSILTTLGLVTATPVANTIQDRLKSINTTLGTPFQAGASIGNTSFGISGTLPAFAAIPAFKVDQTTPGTTNNVTVLSSTAPVSTMNSASAASGVTSANAYVFDDVSPTAITENNFGYARMSANRNAYQTIRDSAGNERGVTVNANNALNTSIDQTTAGSTNGVSPVANATGGSSTTGNIVANNTTAVVVKASAGTLYSIQMYGIGSAPAYLKIYNATSATCGSGTPVKRLMIPAASTAANGGGSNIDFGAAGVKFGTGITYCVTTGIGDADTTAPAASTFLVNLDWQ